MKLTKTPLEDLIIIEPKVHIDSRGYFMESYNKNQFDQNHLNYHFVQDNESQSEFGVIRGLHFQIPPFQQTKLVRVSYGEALDVVVDLRPNSKTFGKSFSILLSMENKKQLLIPKGFAHGYSVLSERCIFNYKCDEFYHAPSESGIHPMDTSLNIDWMIPIEKQIISDKDLNWPGIKYYNF